ncbi:MAG: TGS domain-containing protein, partial [Candidatus Thermoplasmatota archaeon]|nr:TGS domain-containing protein [Candidatus Thermoplasmatota archaeon]
DAQRAGLERITAFISGAGVDGAGTGVQRCLETAVLDQLDLIVAFPVEDETHYADSHGKVLPDGYLLPRGATALELAYKVHSDIGDGFIRAIDCRTKRIIGKDHVLQDGDVVKIVAG